MNMTACCGAAVGDSGLQPKQCSSSGAYHACVAGDCGQGHRTGRPHTESDLPEVQRQMSRGTLKAAIRLPSPTWKARLNLTASGGDVFLLFK
jgi:hypothetical protein